MSRRQHPRKEKSGLRLVYLSHCVCAQRICCATNPRPDLQAMVLLYLECEAHPLVPNRGMAGGELHIQDKEEPWLGGRALGSLRSIFVAHIRNGSSTRAVDPTFPTGMLRRLTKALNLGLARSQSLALTQCYPSLNDFLNFYPKCLILLERAMGFEPTTPTLARLCSTPELHPRSGLPSRSCQNHPVRA